MPRQLIKIIMAIVSIGIAVTGISGCSSVSDEQLKELESLRSEVRSLNNEVNSLKDQKVTLEKEIAERNSKLDECTKLKTETQKNLEMIGK